MRFDFAPIRGSNPRASHLLRQFASTAECPASLSDHPGRRATYVSVDLLGPLVAARADTGSGRRFEAGRLPTAMRRAGASISW